MELTVYLAGQIHDDWRDTVVQKAEEKNLPLTFTGPQTDHDLSDNIGLWSRECKRQILLFRFQIGNAALLYIIEVATMWREYIIWNLQYIWQDRSTMIGGIRLYRKRKRRICRLHSRDHRPIMTFPTTSVCGPVNVSGRFFSSAFRSETLHFYILLK